MNLLKNTIPLFSLGLLCLSHLSHAENAPPSSQELGKITEITGKAWIVRGQGQNSENKTPLQLNTPLKSGDTLTTEGDARVQLILGQKEVALLVKNESQLKLRRNPDQSLLVELEKGMLLSSVKPHPFSPKSHYQVKTHAATIGVRGTVFFVKASPQQTFLCTCSGMIAIDNKAIVLGKNHNTPRIIVNGKQPVAKRLKSADRGTDHTDAEAERLNKMLE